MLGTRRIFVQAQGKKDGDDIASISIHNAGSFMIRIRMWASPDDQIARFLLGNFRTALSYDIRPMKSNYAIHVIVTGQSDIRLPRLLSLLRSEWYFFLARSSIIAVCPFIAPTKWSIVETVGRFALSSTSRNRARIFSVADLAGSICSSVWSSLSLDENLTRISNGSMWLAATTRRGATRRDATISAALIKH